LAVLIAAQNWADFPKNEGRVLFVSFLTFLAFTLTVIVFLFDLVLFVGARHRYQNAILGNAIWITLGALLSLLVAAWIAFHSAFKKAEK